MLEIAFFTTDDVDAFISAANRLINREVEPDTSMDAEGLTQLETWLAVHFVKVKEGVVTRDSVSGTGGGDVSTSYDKQTGKYLDATYYGQMAMVLDDTGSLRLLNNEGAAQVGLRSVEIYNKEPYGDYG